jgi:hypothetical protein
MEKSWADDPCMGYVEKVEKKFLEMMRMGC